MGGPSSELNPKPAHPEARCMLWRPPAMIPGAVTLEFY